MDAGEIINRAARQWGVDPATLRTTLRSRRIAHARHAAAWALRRATDLTVVEIGALLHRDHSTVVYAVQAVEERRQTDNDLAERLAAILGGPVAQLERRDPAVADFLRECGL